MNSFLELAKARYSVRKYKPAAVEQEKIDRILEAARVAPTACNNQPQKIYIIKSEEKRKALAEVCPCTFDAPVIFAVGLMRILRQRESSAKITITEKRTRRSSAVI